MGELTAPMLESRQRDDPDGLRLLVFARPGRLNSVNAGQLIEVRMAEARGAKQYEGQVGPTTLEAA